MTSLQTQQEQHVIPILDAFNSTSPHPIIIMPRFSPLTIITNNHALYVVQLVNAVRYIHSRLIVHLDIKPGNVVVDVATQKLYLIDFGLALQMKSLDEQVQGARGTPDMVAPELHLSSFPEEGGFALSLSDIEMDSEVLFNPFLVDTWAVGLVILHIIDFSQKEAFAPLDKLSDALRRDDPSERLSLSKASLLLHDIIGSPSVKNEEEIQRYVT